jgi:hypothetical protein
LGLQAGQFLVAELHGGELRFGLGGELIEFVVLVVNFDGGHVLSFHK